jgi:hypothetical protein
MYFSQLEISLEAEKREGVESVFTAESFSNGKTYSN